MGYTWDDMYDRLRVDHGGLPGRSTQDMLNRFWTLAGYPDGTLGADQKEAFYRSQGAIGVALGDLEHDYWHRVGPNIMAAMGAEFTIDAAQAINGEQWALNRGSAGQVLRARYGSVGRSEIRNGVGLVLPGSGTNFASVPDEPALDLSGDSFEMVMRCALDTVTAPAIAQSFINKRGAAGTASYQWRSQAGTDRMQLVISDDGTNLLSVTSSAGLPIANGEMAWHKVTWRKSDGRTQFFYAADSPSEPGSWTQLGADQIMGAGLTLFNSTQAVTIGVRQSGDNFPGTIQRAIIRSAIDGPSVLDVDFTTQPDLTTSFVCTTGQTVTITAANAADTNDPLLLPWTGENYVHFPGTTGNGASATLTSAEYPINGVQVEVDFDFGPSAWTTRVPLVFHGGQTAAANQALVLVDTLASGGFIFCYGNGSTASDYAQFSPSPLVGRQRWRFTANTASPARQYVAEYWNGSTWVVHQTITDTDATAIAPMTAGGAFVSVGGGAGQGVNVYSATYRDGALNTIASWRAADMGQTGGVSGGRTWGIGRSATGRKSVVVTRPVWLFGTDDFMEVADNDLLDFGAGQDFTVLAAVRAHGSTDGIMVSKKNSGVLSAGWWMRRVTSSDTQWLSDDGTSQNGGGLSGLPSDSGVLAVHANVRSGAVGTYYRNAASGSAGDTRDMSASTFNVRIGGTSSGVGPFDGEVLAVGIFRRALTPAEIARLVTAYGAS